MKKWYFQISSFSPFIFICVFLSFFTFCGNEEGQFTILSGTVRSTDNDTVRSGELTLYKFSRGVDFYSFRKDLETIPIQNDGTFSFSFFNEKSGGHYIQKKDDGIFTCSEGQKLTLGETNTLDIIAERKQALIKILLAHNLDEKPDSFLLQIRYKEGSCSDLGIDIKQNSLSQTDINDTLSSYLFGGIPNDSMTIYFNAYAANRKIGEEKATFRVNVDTSEINLNFR
ncbi:MAG: hypothetical protein ACI85O_002042 [Saprospiraceae bacterium]|jgi:hypothetical protein